MQTAKPAEASETTLLLAGRTLREIVSMVYTPDELRSAVFCDRGSGSAFGENGVGVDYDEEFSAASSGVQAGDRSRGASAPT